MRSSNRGIDPRVMVYDLSNDPIRFSIDRFKLNKKIMLELKDKFLNNGSTYEDLRRGYYTLSSSSSTALRKYDDILVGSKESYDELMDASLGEEELNTN